MPGITNPAEEYFKDGLWAWVTDQWKKLVATAGGALHIYVAGQAADVEITQTAPWHLTPGVFGWNGSGWHKLPMVWGYSEPLSEVKSDPDAAAGADSLAGTAVPDGEVWVVEAICAVDVTTDISKIRLTLLTVDGIVILLEADPTAADAYVYWNGRITMTKDRRIIAYFTGTAAGDDIHLRYSGYKMKIAE